jgi:hypothetical protein
MLVASMGIGLSFGFSLFRRISSPNWIVQTTYRPQET